MVFYKDKKVELEEGDIEWREANINDDDKDDDEDPEVCHNFFEDEATTKFEDLTYRFGPNLPETKIRHQGEYPFATGLTLWRGSEFLAKYLSKHPDIVKDKTVLELGAGAGVTGIVSHQLGAKQVYVTDGDIDVLNNLRYNVRRNITGNVDCIKCPQLIWGKDLDDFVKQVGKQDVLIGADCVYMPSSLEPMWQTIDKLLVDNDKGVFIWFNPSCRQVDPERVLETAKKYRFRWEQPQFSLLPEDNDKDDDISMLKLFNEELYVFRRTTIPTSK